MNRRRWKVQDSRELYNIAAWGRGFFDIDDNGCVTAAPIGPQGPRIDLHELVEGLVERGIGTPILLRFPDIARTRIDQLAEAFAEARREMSYEGAYRGVYPIKVNQQRDLVEELVRFSGPHHFGLEAGSKPELLTAMALLDDPKALIVCNGYKDEAYIRTAFVARKLGRNPVIVVEKPDEIETIVQVASTEKVRPLLGLRARLSQQGKGRWRTSSGDRAKFGLGTEDLVRSVERLRAAGLLEHLRMLHFHLGSQVTSIRAFKQALKEAARIYTELVALGAPMGFVDVGGGLGVDYDGSRTDFESSMNYSEQEYANDVVFALQSAADRAGVPHPTIVTEAGRAMVAYHAVLVFDIVGRTSFPTDGQPVQVHEDDPDLLHDMLDTLQHVGVKNLLEAYHDAAQLKDEGLVAFNLGLLTLEQRARLERLYWQVMGKVRRLVDRMAYVSEDLADLDATLADTYYGNFSVFQSMPDAWAIGQLFPILPLHRNTERPTRRAVIADLTCDSDGRIDRFVDLRDVRNALELHPWSPGQTYRLGVFLVGAYQEILGDLHNLFGDTNSVHVVVDPDAPGGWRIDHVREGDAVSDVLGYVGYNRRTLVARVRRAAERAVQRGDLEPSDARTIVRSYQAGLDAYTYLEKQP